MREFSAPTVESEIRACGRTNGRARAAELSEPLGMGLSARSLDGAPERGLRPPGSDTLRSEPVVLGRVVFLGSVANGVK